MLRPDAEGRRVQLQENNRESMMLPSLRSRPANAAAGGVDPDGGT
jgi:hypothetical protein